MATRSACLLLLVVGLFGCQQDLSDSNLPDVGFNSPRVAPPSVPRPPAPAPLAVRPALPVPAPPHPVVASAVPPGWMPAVPPRPWHWIVIHHSATSFGSAQIIDGWHRDKGWDELGYDFVIDNGTSGTADGQIEVGPRWTKQKWGAHTKTADNRFNDYGIGICLVGNFDVDRPTAKQMRSVVRLVAYLMKTYRISPDCVLGHNDAKPTDCPGRYMSVAGVRQEAARQLLAEGDLPEGRKLAANSELLRSADAK